MKKRTREVLNLDITPLIDVVFLLLIFFMVSTVFKKDELALLLSLPKATKGEAVAAKNDIVIIELSKEELAYNKNKISFEELSSKLLSITKKDTPIDVRIDKDVKYERVVKVLDQLKKSSLTNLSLITAK